MPKSRALKEEMPMMREESPMSMMNEAKDMMTSANNSMMRANVMMIGAKQMSSTMKKKKMMKDGMDLSQFDDRPSIEPIRKKKKR